MMLCWRIKIISNLITQEVDIIILILFISHKIILNYLDRQFEKILTYFLYSSKIKRMLIKYIMIIVMILLWMILKYYVEYLGLNHLVLSQLIILNQFIKENIEKDLMNSFFLKILKIFKMKS